MLKQINKLLKLVGLNLVRAKRPKGVKWHGRLVVSTCEDPTPLLLALTEAADPKSFSAGPNPGEVPLSKYQDDYEWKNIPDNPSCAVGKSVPCTTVPNPGLVVIPKSEMRRDFAEFTVGTENVCIGPEAEVQIVAPSVVFIPVDIGADDHNIDRVEHPK